MRSNRNGMMICLITSAVLGLAPAEPASLPALNAKVLEFARSQRGRKVGEGSCTDLAVEALRHAGARLDFAPAGDGDFVWGRRIDNPAHALPGDLIQFRDAVFKGRKVYPSGAIRTWTYTYLHHTAIISRVSKGGKMMAVLHQNVSIKGRSDESIVREMTINLAELQPGGKVWIYRPEEK
ncbi:MAG: hypothetical protein IRY99_22175 [Isosphaeraceae bacterium]|nr:hypothetical protein [Isosphaeraceae bacterium]